MPFLPRTRVVSACLLLALAGCVTTGDHALAPIDVPVRYRGGDDAARTALTPPSTYPARDAAADAWWQGFGDPRLERMVAQALAVNTDLATAGLTLQRARLQAGLAGAALWPSASGSVSSSASRSIERHDTVARSSSASVSLGWEIDLWGKLRAQRDAAAWEAQATAEDLENTVLLLVGDVCSQYWQLAYLNQSLAAGEANLERLRRTRDLVAVQFAAGEVSRLEVREADQSLESQTAAQSRLLQQREETRTAIAILLDGMPWPQADEPQDLDALTAPALAEGLPATLLARRPDLRAAELRLRGSLASLHATAASYYPAISLTGGVGSSATSLGDVLRNPVATLGAGLSLPFLDIQRARLDTRIAGVDYEIAANGFRSTLRTALGEVDDALSARTQLAVQADAAQASHDAARDVARMYEVRYRSGASDLRTWLDAQQTLRDAELALAQARREQLDNAVTLYKALGGSAPAG